MMKLKKKLLSQFTTGNVVLKQLNENKNIIFSENYSKAIIIEKDFDVPFTFKFNVSDLLKFYSFKKNDEYDIQLDINSHELYTEFGKTIEKTWFDNSININPTYEKIYDSVSKAIYDYENVLCLKNNPLNDSFSFVSINGINSYLFNINEDGTFFFKSNSENTDYVNTNKHATITTDDSLVFSIPKGANADIYYYYLVGNSTKRGSAYLEIYDNNVSIKSYNEPMFKSFQNLLYSINSMDRLDGVSVTDKLELYKNVDEDIKKRIVEIISDRSKVDSNTYIRIKNESLIIINAVTGKELFKTSYPLENLSSDEYYDFPCKLWKNIILYRDKIVNIYKYNNNNMKYFLVELNDSTRILCVV